MKRNEIYIKVRYGISHMCSGSCLTTLDMYVLQTNDSGLNFTRNVSVFGTRPVASLNDTIRDGQAVTTRLNKIIVDLSTAGFYVAFRDLGTCITIYELSVFYPVCDAISLELGANFTNTRFPGENSTGMCFPNMAIDINSPNAPFNATCNVTKMSESELITNWTTRNGPSRCMCLPGYEFVGGSNPSTQCQGLC